MIKSILTISLIILIGMIIYSQKEDKNYSSLIKEDKNYSSLIKKDINNKIQNINIEIKQKYSESSEKNRSKAKIKSNILFHNNINDISFQSVYEENKENNVRRKTKRENIGVELENITFQEIKNNNFLSQEEKSNQINSKLYNQSFRNKTPAIQLSEEALLKMIEESSIEY